MITCPACQGSMFETDGGHICGLCKGRGKVSLAHEVQWQLERSRGGPTDDKALTDEEGS
jgi:uncharacterized Zn finger protein (UPF0148 family)